MTEYKGYCVKCKEKGVLITEPVASQMKTGVWSVKGKHAPCKTTVCCIVGKEKPKI